MKYPHRQSEPTSSLFFIFIKHFPKIPVYKKITCIWFSFELEGDDFKEDCIPGSTPSGITLQCTKQCYDF